MKLAYDAYIVRRFNDAIRITKDMIREAPMLQRAWNLLAIIYEENNQPQLALQTYLFAAQISVNDATLWGFVAKLSL